MAGTVALLISSVDDDLIICQAAHHSLKQAIDASADDGYAWRIGIYLFVWDRQGLCKFALHKAA